MARQETDKVVIVPGAPGDKETFVDSRGGALRPAEKALYGRDRLAKDRLHWLFSPSKDLRVAQLLSWIHSMSHGLASLGVQRFLEGNDRGALITNVEYRAKKAPHEPAFDWLPWTKANDTFDRILQQSLAYYDPETQVVVFVFLLSRSENSMAIWRRKITIPHSIRVAYGEALRNKKAELAQKKMVIRVDDAYETTGGHAQSPNGPVPPKKKWFRWAV